MTFPILAAFVVLTGQGDSSPYSQPQGVAEPTRLALTPTLDGNIGTDEWDGFAKSGEGETFMQWEPNKLYVAAKMPEGRDLVISLDTKQDGWLVGKDNLEIRLRALEGGKVSITARQLDATNVAGPTWVPLPGYSQSSEGVAKSDGTTTSLEAAIIDPGLNRLPIKDNERFLARMDVVAQTSQSSEPFLPRQGTLVKLSMQRASAMPVGLNWGLEDSGRVLTPGGSTKIRFTFNSKEEQPVKKIEIKLLGPLAEQTTSIGIPFPAFDRKGRAFVDYETKTEKTAPKGYHLLAGTLTTSDGAPAMIQASFRIAPLIDFELVNGPIHMKDVAQTIKIPFIIHSNSTRRLDGLCEVGAPEGWEILKGDDKSFIIYNARSGVRRVLTVTIPAGAKGAFPMKFKGSIGQQTFEETGWVTIEEK